VTNDENDRLVATTDARLALNQNSPPQLKMTRCQSERCNKGASTTVYDSNYGVINLCDDDEDITENSSIYGLINIDDNTEFPSVAAAVTIILTEHPKTKNDIKKELQRNPTVEAAMSQAAIRARIGVLRKQFAIVLSIV
jgi:hypothetical protein